MHHVVALCFDGLVAFDLATPAQVFRLAVGREGRPRYRFSTCTPDGGPVGTTTGFRIAPGLAPGPAAPDPGPDPAADAPVPAAPDPGPDHAADAPDPPAPAHDDPMTGLAALAVADTVLVPGYADVFEPLADPVRQALRDAAERGARVFSVCTGAFALAHAGLLEGRRATTHWAYADALAALSPNTDVDSSVLFVDEDDVLTSAGLSAGIDLCLHIVRKDCGAEIADRVARMMVAPPHRDGGQAQFARRPRSRTRGGTDTDLAADTLEPTRLWASERLGEPLTVAAMAAHANVSPRTFARRFREETGTTPLQWLLAQRVLEARRLLEQTDLPVEEIAWQAGFGTAASLREHFHRSVATTPTAYRRTFRAPTATFGQATSGYS